MPAEALDAPEPQTPHAWRIVPQFGANTSFASFVVLVSAWSMPSAKLTIPAALIGRFPTTAGVQHQARSVA